MPDENTAGRVWLTMEDVAPKATGVKHDGDKPRMDLLDPLALEGLAQVLTFGANKYSTRGDCDCLVSIVNQIVKFGPEDFVKAATTLATLIATQKPKQNSQLTNVPTVLNIQIICESISVNTWWQTLTSSRNVVETLLKQSTGSTTTSLILSLHKLTAEFAAGLSNYASTTITPPEQCESAFVSHVTSLLDSLKKESGLLKHSSTCPSTRVLVSGANNWRGGISYSRLIAAALRHLFAVVRGEDLDPESGLPHVDHLGCCWMFLSNMMKTRKDLDDRYHPQ